MIIPPQPSERLRKDRLPLARAVETVTEDELVIVAGKRERLRHLLRREGPVAVVVIEIVLAILKEDADGLPRRLADHRLVVVATFAAGGAGGDVREAANPREDLAEFVRALPRRREGADTAATDAADRAARGV